MLPPNSADGHRRPRAAWIAGPAAILAAWLVSGAVSASDAPPGIGLIQDVQFTRYAALSASAEILKRMLSPLADEMTRDRLAASGKTLAPQPVDLTQERFVVFIPAHRPPDGYGLLVFVPPWPEARIPASWLPVFDAAGVIAVSAAHSGNDQSVLGRRAPLALLELENIRRLYPIDPVRTYVGGFSGGSRVAERLALDYPDVFDGALLDAGADPIGAAPDQYPSRDLLRRFQVATRIAYVSGSRDLGSLATDGQSLASLRKACVFDADARITAFAGHEVADAPGLSWALRLLAAPAKPEPKKLAACQARLDGELKTRLTQAQALIARGDRSAARHAILKIDSTFGAMAAAQIVDLADRCACALLPVPGARDRASPITLPSAQD